MGKKEIKIKVSLSKLSVSEFIQAFLKSLRSQNF